MQMAQLKNVTGLEYDVDDPEDEMAGISVQGDTHVTIAGSAQESPLKKLLPVALASLLGAAGAYFYLKPETLPEIIQPDPNWQLSVEVSDEP